MIDKKQIINTWIYELRFNSHILNELRNNDDKWETYKCLNSKILNQLDLMFHLDLINLNHYTFLLNWFWNGCKTNK